MEGHTKILESDLHMQALTNAMVELEEWYFGNIDSILAINKCKEDGDFLVRHSVSKQQYVITCRWKGTCRNYLIQVRITI